MTELNMLGFFILDEQDSVADCGQARGGEGERCMAYQRTGDRLV